MHASPNLGMDPKNGGTYVSDFKEIHFLVVMCTLATGVKMLPVGKGLLHGLMDLHSMDCGKMEDVTDGENYTVLTDFNMMEIGWKMQWKVEVGQSIPTDNNMMECG